MTNGNGKKGLMSRDDIKFFVWAVVLAITVATSWVRTDSRLDAVCDRMDRVEARLGQLDPTLTGIQVALGQLRTDVQWIRVELNARGGP